jgi:hypothetical protein
VGGAPGLLEDLEPLRKAFLNPDVRVLAEPGACVGRGQQLGKGDGLGT